MYDHQKVKNSSEATILSSKCCAFCGSGDDEKAIKVCGEKRTSGNVTAHYFCMLFSSGLCQRGGEQEAGAAMWGFLDSDIIHEVLRARKLKCRFCKNVGASIGCFIASCSKKFHFPCAVANGVLCQYFGTFRCYCSDHRPRQTLPPACRNRSTAMEPLCAVCLCDVDTLVPTDDVLLMPCCQNQLLHRECLQRQAVASGIHFFKCPLCNNKDLFQKEMLRYGIYIPDQDAAWELEDQAFSDLLQRHNRCDVDECICPDGRDINTLDTCWEIMLCDFCGSRGTHLECSNLKTPMDDWDCAECHLTLLPFLTSSPIESPRKRARLELESSSSAQPTSSNSRPHASRGRPPSTVSRTSSNAAASAVYRPRARRLSLYVQRHRDSDVPATRPVGPLPRWLRGLLNDDIHTGRNVGTKLAYMCEDEKKNDDERPAPTGENGASGAHLDDRHEDEVVFKSVTPAVCRKENTKTKLCRKVGNSGH